LLEQPGAWGIDALFESRLPESVALALHERAHSLKVRVILIRRPDGSPERLNVFLAHTGGTRTRPALFHGVVDDPAALLELDLRPLHAGKPVGFGQPFEGPLFLVCTNSRHDVCCAERGRPVFRALAGVFPERTWECSHIGGDRFAGNVVCFPHGLYYGWVEADEAAGIARAYEQGRLDLRRYRGRSSWPVEVQFAEQALRERLGLTGVGDIAPVSRAAAGDGAVEVTFRDRSGNRHVVQISSGEPEPQYLTCRAEAPSVPRAFEVR
jgi:hypothetical protein